jgi:hypothetical protein
VGTDILLVPHLRRQWGPNSSSVSGEGSEEHSREDWNGPTGSETLPYSLSEYCKASYVLRNQNRISSNANELPTAFDNQWRLRKTEREDLTSLLNPVGGFELHDNGTRSSRLTELANCELPPGGISELAGSSSRSTNVAVLPVRGSNGYTERESRTRLSRADVAELPGDQPIRRPHDRRSDTTSSRSRFIQSTTAPISQPPRQPSDSRRHSDQSTHRRTSTSRDRPPRSRRRHEAYS